MMRICIFGGGSIGGLIAARLALSGQDVSVVARGPNLHAMQARGLTLAGGDETHTVAVRASDDPADLGTQDAVIVAVKATGLAAIGPGLPPLLQPGTVVAFALNGIPWWYGRDFHARPGGPPLPDLGMLDEGGTLGSILRRHLVLGCVVYAAASVVDPGTVVNTTAGANRLILGQTDGGQAETAVRLSAALEQAGFAAPLVGDIRAEVWRKLVFNLFQNSICGIIERPLNAIGRSPDLTRLAKATLAEGLAIARAYGIDLGLDPETALGPRQIHAPHKPSLLQDLEQGRPAEIKAILVATQAFARRAAVATPHLDTIAALLIERASNAGSYVP